MSESSIPEDWKAVELGEISSPKQWPTISQENLSNHGYKVYGANGVIGYYHAFTHRDSAVAVTCRGSTCGEVTITEPMSYITGNAMVLDNLDRDSATPQYIAYFLKRDGLRNYITGSAQPQIIGSALKSVPITLPPLSEQELICKILDRLDASIRKTEAIIEKLKQIKQGLLHDLLTRGIDANGELRPPPELAPQLYKESPLGLIPSSWKSMDIGDALRHSHILEIQDGNHGELHPKHGDFVKEGIPFLMANDLNNGVIDFDGCHKITQKQYSSLRIGFAKSGDVLLSHKGTIGNTAIIPNIPNEAMLTPQVTYYRVNNQTLLNKFLYLWFQASSFLNKMQALSAQSTRAYLGIQGQRQLPITMPSMQEQIAIVDSFSNIDDLLITETRRFYKLKNEKTALMNDLLTGQVRVTPLLAEHSPAP